MTKMQPAAWHTCGASVIGTSHERDGTTCQDDHAILHLPNALLIAVADGAGSAKHGGTGATIAVHAATSYLAGASTGHTSFKAVLGATAKHCRDVLRSVAISKGDAIHDYATTLFIGVITDKYLGTLQVGDGAIVTQNGEKLTTLSVPQEREYCNEVTFLTCDNYQRELQLTVTRCKELRGIALCTDGVESLGVNKRDNQPHKGFFNPLFTSPPTNDELRDLLGSTSVCKLTDDDKTLVIATRGRPSCLPA